MSSRLSTITAAVLGTAGFLSCVTAEVKIGLIDFARLQREYYRTYEERENFEKKRSDARKKVEERGEKLKELLSKQQEAEKSLKDPTLSEASKKKVLSDARERVGQITSLQKETIELESRTNGELANLANQIQRSLTKQIYDTIGTVAGEKGLDVVLNRTFGINGVPTVAYSSTKNLEDFTDAVSARLNEKAPKGWTPPAGGSGEILENN